MPGIAKKTVDEVSKINAVQAAGVVLILIALNFMGGLIGVDVYGMLNADPGMGLFILAVQLLIAVTVARILVMQLRGRLF